MVCAGPALLSSGDLMCSPDKLPWFLRLSNCGLLSGMENANIFLVSGVLAS